MSDSIHILARFRRNGLRLVLHLLRAPRRASQGRAAGGGGALLHPGKEGHGGDIPVNDDDC